MNGNYYAIDIWGLIAALVMASSSLVVIFNALRVSVSSTEG